MQRVSTNQSPSTFASLRRSGLAIGVNGTEPGRDTEVGPRRAAGVSLRLEPQRRADLQMEASAAGLLDADDGVALFEPSFEQDQARVEVVAKAWKVERRIEPHLLVGELDRPSCWYWLSTDHRMRPATPRMR